MADSSRMAMRRFRDGPMWTDTCSMVALFGAVVASTASQARSMRQYLLWRWTGGRWRSYNDVNWEIRSWGPLTVSEKARRTGRRQPAGGEPWLRTVVDVVIRGTGKTLSGSGSNYEVEGWECSASCSRCIIPSATSGLLGSQQPSEGTVADEEMGFLMQPIKRFTVLEEVNDSDVPMAPLHYLVGAAASGELQHAQALELSMDGQICATQTVVVAEREISPQKA
ncbi:uncharacterized protein LOC125519503 [Triticum urartu]|uniref:uncharacterized protein LOC125519503 n=1 Tax=Triticum urartu TaxID=4572 RepID=UPI0020445BCA|nr:uncharacterized protein LOC125519503 [Triticum urartu]